MKNKMKRRLQTRFVLIAVCALLILQAAIVSFTIARSYRQMTLRADAIIRLTETSPDASEIRDARYYKVIWNRENRTFEVDLSHTALVTRAMATEQAKTILDQNSDSGYLDSYRYLVRRDKATVKIVFLSRSVAIESFRSNAKSLILISLFGILFMTALLFAVSGVAVAPLVRNRQKQKEFITSASHALKTPLTVIDADAQLLELEIGENEWLSDIRKQTSLMTEMTHRLVYLSRAEEQRDEVVRIEFPISDVVREIADSYSAVAKQRGKTLVVSVERDISYSGDENAVKELITVLLDNALKYAPEGGEILVSLSAFGHSVCFMTENDAFGEAKNEVAAFSERFYRADSSRKTDGFGIGLSVANAVAENHKGKLTIELTKQGKIRISAVLR